MNTNLKKVAVCTDIHFGKKNNDKLHNEDCIRFLEWFKSNVEKDPEIDHIMFLGDWNENRSSLNVETLNYSYKGAKILNSIGLPVYFVIGNHDLYRRYSREIYSVIPYEELENFHMITQPTIIPEIGNGGALMCPYMFEDEYNDLKQYANIETWWGHFEFKGFIVTGYDFRMPTGPDPLDFKGPEYIFSGHFHKRQAHENICYLGNCFPMDFGDAGDNERGMMIFDHTVIGESDPVSFIDWPDCPKYIKTTLSDLLDENVELLPNSHVKCTIDIVLSYEESTELKNMITNKYDLREFNLEESPELKSAISDTVTEQIDWESTKLKGVSEIVVDLLSEVDNNQIDNDLLVKIYQGLNEQKIVA